MLHITLKLMRLIYFNFM